MDRIDYSVLATLPDRRTADEYIRWLLDGHVAAVIAGGALEASVGESIGESPVVETRYLFADRESFDRYQREVAPALRADGVSRFGSSDVRFERRVLRRVADFPSA